MARLVFSPMKNNPSLKTSISSLIDCLSSGRASKPKSKPIKKSTNSVKKHNYQLENSTNQLQHSFMPSKNNKRKLMIPFDLAGNSSDIIPILSI